MDNKWHLIVDTSFLQANRFLWGKRIIEINSLVDKNLVIIYVTDVILRELRKHMVEKLKQECLSIKNTAIFHELYPKEHENLSGVKGVESKIDEVINNWIKKYDVQVLPSKDVDINAVLDLYFLNQKPFGPNGKSKEFPDAIIYDVCKQYFSLGYEKVYLITRDKDFLDIKDDIINFVYSDNAGDLFSEILELAEKEAIDFIKEEFLFDTSKELDLIEMQIKELLTDEIEEIYINDSIDEVYVDFAPRVQDEKCQVTLLNEELDCAELEYSFTATASVSVSGDNYESAIYDKEDGIYVNVIPIRNTFETQIFVQAYFGVNNVNTNPEFKLYNVEAKESYYKLVLSGFSKSTKSY